MKCQVILIGDWVQINGIPRKIQAIDIADAEIQADGEVFYVGEDRYSSGDKIDGVPITCEILEKNEDGIHFIWKRGTLSIWLDDEKYNERRCQNVIIPVKYVHQVQQVLRVIGLDELANNFKI